jgi:hypothetical protein
MAPPAAVQHLAAIQILTGALTALGMSCLWLCWGATGIEMLVTGEIAPDPDMDAERTRSVLNILLIGQLLLLLVLGGARIGLGLWMRRYPAKGRGVARALTALGLLVSPLLGDLVGFVGGLISLLLLTRADVSGWYQTQSPS